MIQPRDDRPPTSPDRVLIVDDDRALAETLADGLADLGYDAVAVASSEQALQRMSEDFAALVTDLRMPGTDGLGLLVASKRVAPERPVIVMTAYSAVDSAIESIRQGAYHYLTKPFKVDELALFLGRSLEDARLRRETRTLRRAMREGQSLETLVGSGAAMGEVASVVRRIADTNVPVLVLGETGTGKGLVARALHGEGSRAQGPFVTVNCAAIPERAPRERALRPRARRLHRRGRRAARRLRGGERRHALPRRDRRHRARGAGQAAPRAASAAIVARVGSEHVSARSTCASSRRPTATSRRALARGEFREDLLFRLNVVPVRVPALRDRRGRHPVLAERTSSRAAPETPARQASRCTAPRPARWQRRWPGNVRELEHLVERSLLLGSDVTIGVGDLPRALQEAPERLAVTLGPVFAGTVLPMADLQRRYAAWALDQLGGRRMLTAEKLDVDRKTLAKLLTLSSEEAEAAALEAAPERSI